MRRCAQVLPVSALAIAVCCCAQRPLAPASAPALDRKLSTFVFLEEGKLVSFAVDTRATREREEGPFIPFEICVANRGVKSLSLTRESFTLIDEEGNRYPCVGPRDLLEGYEYLDFDRRLAEVAGIVESRFSVYTRYPSTFSPVRGTAPSPFQSTLVRDALSLPQYGYIVDFLYFPKPKTGVKGHRFEMFLEAPELPDPVFVKFVVK